MNVVDIKPFNQASKIAQDFSQWGLIARPGETSKEFEATADAIEATAASPAFDEWLLVLTPEVIEDLHQSMDSMSLQFAAIRRNVREAPFLFRLLFFFSIRRFYRSSQRILAVIEKVRATLPAGPAPSSKELEADANLLAHLRHQGGEWVSLDKVLQEDQTWRSSK